MINGLTNVHIQILNVVNKSHLPTLAILYISSIPSTGI